MAFAVTTYKTQEIPTDNLFFTEIKGKASKPIVQYVALSRVKSLNKLLLLRSNSEKGIMNLKPDQKVILKQKRLDLLSKNAKFRWESLENRI